MTGVTPLVRRQVIERDRNICQWCGLWVETEGGFYSLQHRRARGMGGSSRIDTNLPSNLVLVHGSGVTLCHGHIESHRDEAARRGFNVAQRLNPTEVPLLVRSGPAGQWVRFDVLGGVEWITAGEATAYMESIGVAA